MMKKTILIDCDGVVFNWEYAFSLWMEEHGFETVEGHQFMYDMGERYDIPKEQVKKLVKMFNESAMIGFLPALRDSVEYVTKMADEGWEFIAITSLSLNKYAKRLRTQNLEKLFGKGTFVKVTCLATGAEYNKKKIIIFSNSWITKNQLKDQLLANFTDSTTSPSGLAMPNKLLTTTLLDLDLISILTKD